VAVPQPTHGSIEGQVIRADNAPTPGVQLTFVRTGTHDERQPVTADASGKFNVQLPAGGWMVYLTGSDGKTVYHSQIDVRGAESRQVLLVSR
jgi:hypothetical protein